MATHHCTPCLIHQVYCSICEKCDCEYQMYEYMYDRLKEVKLKPYTPKESNKINMLHEINDPQNWNCTSRDDTKIVLEYYAVLEYSTVTHAITIFAAETNNFKDTIKLRKLINERIKKVYTDVRAEYINKLVNNILNVK